MAIRRAVALTLSLAAVLPTSFALAQGEPPKSPVIVPPPAKPPPPKPPEKKVDTEFDPDAKPKEPPPLPPVQQGQWGVGGKDEEGQFAPQTKKKKDDEERAKKEAEENKKPIPLGPPRVASFDTVIGFGTMRDITNDTDRTSTTVASFIFGFSWRLGDTWTLEARFPFIRGSVSGPAGPFNTFAVGNLELGTKPAFQLTRRLRLPAEASVFFPTAQGDLFPPPETKNVAIAQAQLNQAASWSRGWEEMPLFATKRFGIRLGAGIVWTRETSEETASATPALAGGLRIEAGVRLDTMIRTGGGDVPDEPVPMQPGMTFQRFKISSPTLAWTTRASIHYAFFDGKLEPGLRMWLTYASLPVTGITNDYSGAQFVLEPQINGRFPVVADKSMAVKAGIGFILPLGGSLGGGNAPLDAAIKGFRINAGFEF